MGRPVFAVDNLFSTTTYPNHTLAASHTAADAKHAVELLAAARRDRNLTGYIPDTFNAETTVTATYDRLRAGNLLWIDRDHNLGGESLSVRFSNDAFTTYTEIGPKTVPSVSTPYSHLYDGEIIQTEEGALLWWLELNAAWASRVVVAAMGANERPEIAGLGVFYAWAPDHPPVKPFDYGKPRLVYEQTRTPSLQVTGSEKSQGDGGTIRLKLDLWEAEEARYTLEELYLGRGKPMVIVHDDERAERAHLAFAPPGSGGLETSGTDWSYPRAEIPWVEEDPVAL